MSRLRVGDERGDIAELVPGGVARPHVPADEVGVGFFDLAPEVGHPALDHGLHEVGLGFEVVEQPALGDLGLRGDRIQRQRLRAVAVDDARSGVSSRP